MKKSRKRFMIGAIVSVIVVITVFTSIEKIVTMNLLFAILSICSIGVTMLPTYFCLEKYGARKESYNALKEILKHYQLGESYKISASTLFRSYEEKDKTEDNIIFFLYLANLSDEKLNIRINQGQKDNTLIIAFQREGQEEEYKKAIDCSDWKTIYDLKRLIIE